MEEKKVRFSRNKTTREALSSEDRDTIYFTKDTRDIVMGGEIYGLENKKRDYIDNLYQEHLKDLFTISISVTKSVVNPGSLITFSVVLMNSGKFCSSDGEVSGTGFLKDINFTEISNGVYRATVLIDEIGDYRSTIKASYSGIEKSESILISCRENIIWGWSELSRISGPSKLKDAKTFGPALESSGEYKFQNTKPGYYYFLIPNGTILSSSLSGNSPQGLEGPIPVYFTKQVSPEVDGYSVFRISDAQAPSSHLIKIY